MKKDVYQVHVLVPNMNGKSSIEGPGGQRYDAALKQEIPGEDVEAYLEDPYGAYTSEDLRDWGADIDGAHGIFVSAWRGEYDTYAETGVVWLICGEVETTERHDFFEEAERGLLAAKEALEDWRGQLLIASTCPQSLHALEQVEAALSEVDEAKEHERLWSLGDAYASGVANCLEDARDMLDEKDPPGGDGFACPTPEEASVPEGHDPGDLPDPVAGE